MNQLKFTVTEEDCAFAKEKDEGWLAAEQALKRVCPGVWCVDSTYAWHRPMDGKGGRTDWQIDIDEGKHDVWGLHSVWTNDSWPQEFTMRRLTSLPHKQTLKRVIERVFDRPIMESVQRGLFVEAMVLESLDGRWHQCDHWSGWDLERDDKLRIEVKQSAATQPWHGKGRRVTRPRFDIAPREHGREADGYIFAWHGETDATKTDHRDREQWKFHVVSTKAIDGHDGSRSRHRGHLRQNAAGARCHLGTRRHE